MRVIKSESEVVNMRKAGGASGRAFTESMKHKFTAEKELNAFLQYQFKKQGCDTTAFVPVVAGGSVSNHPVLRPWMCALDINDCRMRLAFTIRGTTISYGKTSEEGYPK